MSVSTATTRGASRSQASLQAEGTVVIGGGIAGLATAAALKQIASVKKVHLLERSPQQQFEDELQGAALQLSPNGLKAIRAFGGDDCLDRVMKEGTKLKGNIILLPGMDPQVIPDTAEENTGLPQVLIRWGKLRRILQTLVNDEDISTECAIQHCFVNDDSGYMEVLDDKGDVVIPETPLIVAADGIRSVFGKMLKSKNNIKDNGRVNIKAVAPRDIGDGYAPDTTYSFFSPGGAVACFAGPAGKGSTYWAISLEEDISQDCDTLQEVQTELLKKLQSVEAPEMIRDLITETDADRIFVRRSEESITVGPTLSDGRSIVLVGDAAHAMSPSYGQSGSMALEDAVTLAHCIKMGDSLEDALESFSEARLSRVEEMLRRSAERTKKAIKGEATEDVSNWIFQWEPPSG